MKTITVKNLMIQFDSFDEKKDTSTIVDEMMRSINELLGNYFSDNNPCIYPVSINDINITVRKRKR